MPVAPPFPKMPSLNALRAFEAAARLGGFTSAADELSVTPGAVAAQIKSLEDELGARLFERHAKGVRLTPLGQRVLPGFIAAFDGLGEAVRNLRREAAPRKIHIAALPALAQLWLGPRLPDLRERLESVDISVTALEHPPNLKRVPFDLCLFYSDKLPGKGTQLPPDRILPVCTPDLAQRLNKPEDLQEEICLSDTTWSHDWHIWMNAALPDRDFVPRGPVFSLYAIAVQEALNGAGVLMAHQALVQPYLDAGELVTPFDTVVTLPEAISLWVLAGARQDKTVSELISVLSELAHS